jgi:hypothetical protein
VRGAVEAVVEKALGAGTVLPLWPEAATVKVLAADCRRIVELVAVAWVRAISTLPESRPETIPRRPDVVGHLVEEGRCRA